MGCISLPTPPNIPPLFPAPTPKDCEDADAYDNGDLTKLLHQDDLSGINVEFRFMNEPEGNVYVNGNNAYMFPVFVRSMDVNTDGTGTAHAVISKGGVNYATKTVPSTEFTTNSVGHPGGPSSARSSFALYTEPYYNLC